MSFRLKELVLMACIVSAKRQVAKRMLIHGFNLHMHFESKQQKTHPAFLISFVPL